MHLQMLKDNTGGRELSRNDIVSTFFWGAFLRTLWKATSITEVRAITEHSCLKPVVGNDLNNSGNRGAWALHQTFFKLCVFSKKCWEDGVKKIEFTSKLVIFLGLFFCLRRWTEREDRHNCDVLQRSHSKNFRSLTGWSFIAGKVQLDPLVWRSNRKAWETGDQWERATQSLEKTVQEVAATNGTEVRMEGNWKEIYMANMLLATVFGGARREWGSVVSEVARTAGWEPEQCVWHGFCCEWFRFPIYSLHLVSSSRPVWGDSWFIGLPDRSFALQIVSFS